VNKIDSPQLLFWEDEATGSGRWWLARAREIKPEGRIDYFIAEDDLTAALVAVALTPRARRYRVVAVASFGEDIGPLEALEALKAAVTTTVYGDAGGIRWPVYRWRVRRFAALLRRDLALAVAGLAGGAVLGLAIAFVASSRFSGGSLVLTGVVIGAMAGPGLKHLVDRNVGEAYPRPWARFAVTLVGAIIGAILAGSIAFTLQWS
jgi:hypothetical protein